MKSKQHIKLFMLSLFICLGSITNVIAQGSADTIVMLNGDKKEGKIKAMGTDSVKFVYTGEDLEYEIKKSEIHQIIFASGRTEVITKVTNTANSSPATTSNAIDRKGKIAVLPFEYITNDPSIMIASMSSKVQRDCIASLKKNTSILLKIQDPMTTNALLKKNGITTDDLLAITPQEMAQKLGVEYVMYGTVNLENKGTLTTGSDVTTYKGKNEKSNNNHKKKSSGLEVSSGSSSTRINYDTHINLNIYSDTGSSIYSDSKRAFGSGLDAYNSSLNYLIKRTPFGTKAKH